ERHSIRTTKEDELLGPGIIREARVDTAGRRADLPPLAPVGAIPRPGVVQQSWNASSAIATKENDIAGGSVVRHAESVARRGRDHGMLLDPAGPIPGPGVGKVAEQVTGDPAGPAEQHDSLAGGIIDHACANSGRRGDAGLLPKPAASIIGPRVTENVLIALAIKHIVTLVLVVIRYTGQSHSACVRA